MKKLLISTCFLLLTSTSLYSGPRHLVSRSITQSRATVHPYQIIIFAPGEATSGDNILNAQGQQRAAYLAEFLLYQGPDGFTVNQASQPIHALYTPSDDSGDFYATHALQTITPIFHQANAIRIEQTAGSKGPLTIEQTYSLAMSPEVLKDMLFDGNATTVAGKTVIICWKLEQISTNSDGLFGDPQIQTYFQRALSNLDDLGTDPTNVWVIQWNQDTPTGTTIKQLGVGGFNVP